MNKTSEYKFEYKIYPVLFNLKYLLRYRALLYLALFFTMQCNSENISALETI